MAPLVDFKSLGFKSGVQEPLGNVMSVLASTDAYHFSRKKGTLRVLGCMPWQYQKQGGGLPQIHWLLPVFIR